MKSGAARKKKEEIKPTLKYNRLENQNLRNFVVDLLLEDPTLDVSECCRRYRESAKLEDPVGILKNHLERKVVPYLHRIPFDVNKELLLYKATRAVVTKNAKKRLEIDAKLELAGPSTAQYLTDYTMYPAEERKRNKEKQEEQERQKAIIERTRYEANAEERERMRAEQIARDQLENRRRDWYENHVRRPTQQLLRMGVHPSQIPQFRGPFPPGFPAYVPPPPGVPQLPHWGYAQPVPGVVEVPEPPQNPQPDPTAHPDAPRSPQTPPIDLPTCFDDSLCVETGVPVGRRSEEAATPELQLENAENRKRGIDRVEGSVEQSDSSSRHKVARWLANPSNVIDSQSNDEVTEEVSEQPLSNNEPAREVAQVVQEPSADIKTFLNDLKPIIDRVNSPEMENLKKRVDTVLEQLGDENSQVNSGIILSVVNAALAAIGH